MGTISESKLRILVTGAFPLDATGGLSGPERGTIDVVRGLCCVPSLDVLVVHPDRFRRLFTRSQVLRESHPRVISVHVLRCLPALRASRPAIVHASGISYFGAVAVLFSRLLSPRISTVYVAHGNMRAEAKHGEVFSRFDAVCERILLGFSSAVVTVSQVAKEALLRDYRFPSDRVHVIPYAVNPSAFSVDGAAAAEFRRSWNLTDVKIVLFVGRLVPTKGLDFLFESLSRLCRDDCRLLVIGNSSQHWTELSRRYAKYCRHHVIRIDALDQNGLAQAYAASDILVLPSRAETFGLVATEAMVFRKPVVVSDGVGMSSLITSGDNGFVVKFGDAPALATVLDQLLSDAEMRDRIGKEGQTTAMALAPRRIAEQYLSLYRAILPR